MRHNVLSAEEGILIPGPNHEVSMILPEDHRFVLFMRGERPYVVEIEEAGEWTCSGELLDDDTTWPVVALAVALEDVEYVMGLEDEDINTIITNVTRKHRKMLH
jgi:hypothetical protein